MCVSEYYSIDELKPVFNTRNTYKRKNWKDKKQIRGKKKKKEIWVETPKKKYFKITR
jgi:hypothetical protein